MLNSWHRLALLASLIAGPALADTREDLIQYLDRLASMSANFEQQRFDEDGELAERVSGACLIQKPGRFLWEYVAPFPQLIVGTGELLWIYDPDLEQATYTPMADAVAGSPAALLSGELAIESAYNIKAGVIDADGTAWFELSPRTDAGDFSRIELGFHESSVNAMRLEDNLGQTTVIRFSDIETNAEIDPERFEFTPPAGVDVVKGASAQP